MGHYAIVFETEASGAVSAYVPGLPVYAAADSHTKAERAIRRVLTAYLEAHPGSRSDARVRVARFSDRQKRRCTSSVWRRCSERAEASQRRARRAPTVGSADDRGR
jgi:hypothetical protein